MLRPDTVMYKAMQADDRNSGGWLRKLGVEDTLS